MTVKYFNETILDLIDNMNDVLNDNSLSSYSTLLRCTKNDKRFVQMFKSEINEDKLKGRDEYYLLNTDLSKMLNFSKYYKKLNDENKKILWMYLDVLFEISKCI